MGRSTPAEAARVFRERVEARGGRVIEPTWLGFAERHRIICGEGHEWAVRPSAVSQGVGICRICAGNDPRTAELRFRARVEELGGHVVEPTWLGATKPHHVICGAGHNCTPRPNDVQQRKGICAICSGCSPAEAERLFRERVAVLGGVLLEPAWLGKGRPHRARCVKGHPCAPIPSNLRMGLGMCRDCAGCDPVGAERRFRERVAELGGEVLEPRWRGNNRPHRVRCGQGHEVTPMPASVQQGHGICRYCAGMHWDAFYVVTAPARHWLKFGITARDGRGRLRQHARDGFTEVGLLLTDMPGNAARELENSVKATLRLAGEKPVRGCEYFDGSVLGLVLDVVSPLSGSQAGGIVGYARPGGK